MTDPDALPLNFEQRVIALEYLCCLEPDWQHLMREGNRLVTELQQAFNQTLLAREAVVWADQPSAQRTVTELHRLLRLLQTDMAFCRAARTPELQCQRRQTLQAHTQQLRMHWQTLYSS
jgi:hypothetical protein